MADRKVHCACCGQPLRLEHAYTYGLAAIPGNNHYVVIPWLEGSNGAPACCLCMVIGVVEYNGELERRRADGEEKCS